MITKNLLILLLITVGAGWFLIRNSFFKSIDEYYDRYVQNEKETEAVEEKYVSLDEVKDILDKAYVSANQILAKSESAKSILELEKGIKYLQEAIKQRNILAGEEPNRMPILNIPKSPPVVDPKEICPEKYGGAKEDYPFYLNQIPLDPACKVPPLNKMVTVVFNFVNEIPAAKAEALFEDAAFCRYQNMTYIAFMKSGTTEIPKLKELAKSKLPNMRIIEYKGSGETHASILYEAVTAVKTKYVVLTRNTERYDNFSTIVRLVRDISLGKTEVVGGSHRNLSGHWKAGCYQMKKLRGELSFDEGYDLSDNGCMLCDYVSGPFGVKTDMFKKYLFDKKNSNLSEDFFYMEFFFYVRLVLQKRIFLCFDSMFYTETVGLQELNKENWLPFQKTMSISKVTFMDHKTSHVFSCKDVNLNCIPNEESKLPFCCFKKAEEILGAITKFLKENKIQYQFHLPSKEPLWQGIYGSYQKKNTIVVDFTGDESVLKKLEIKSFTWSSGENGPEFSSLEWRIIFHVDSKILADPINVRFSTLLLPVNSNPGEALIAHGKDRCTRENICFDLLHDYGTLDTQKVWM